MSPDPAAGARPVRMRGPALPAAASRRGLQPSAPREVRNTFLPTWLALRLESGGQLGRWVFEHRVAGEIKAADEDACIAVERARRSDAEAARHDAPGALRPAERAEALLPELVHRAVLCAARGEQALFAFEDHGEVGRQGVPARSLLHRADAEHQAQAPAVGMLRAGEAHTHTAAIRARAALAFDLGVAPVDIQIHRAADARAQVTIAAWQAAARCAARVRGRRSGRARPGCRLRSAPCGPAGGGGGRRAERREGRQKKHRQAAVHAVSLPPPQAPGCTSNALARRAWVRAIQRAACRVTARITMPMSM